MGEIGVWVWQAPVEMESKEHEQDRTRGVSVALSCLGSSVTPHSWVSLGRGLALSMCHLLLQGITRVPVGSPPSEVHTMGLTAHTATVTVT